MMLLTVYILMKNGYVIREAEQTYHFRNNNLVLCYKSTVTITQ